LKSFTDELLKHHLCWQIIPSIDYTVCDKMFSDVISNVALNKLLYSLTTGILLKLATSKVIYFSRST